MKKAIMTITTTILVLAILVVSVFSAVVITEAKYLPVKAVEYSVTVDKTGHLTFHENQYMDWSGSYTEAILMKADSLTGNAFHLADGLY